MATKKGSGQAAPTMEKKQVEENAERQEEKVQMPSAQIIPDITVRIDKLFTDESKKLKAFASANVGPFAVHGIRVFENEKGMFVSMPSSSYKDAQGNPQYEDVFHPVTKEARDALIDRVMNAYDQALEQAQANAQAPVQDHGSQKLQQM